MGESRDTVEAATEIGVIMMGRPVQNNHRHSVIAVTFRGSRPQGRHWDGRAFGSLLALRRELRRSGACKVVPPDRRPLCSCKPFAVSVGWPVLYAPVSAVQRAWTNNRHRGGLPRAVGS
jgi:hypothetical protein